jgi:hypothetical protein
MPRTTRFGLLTGLAAILLAACSAEVVGSGDVAATSPAVEPFEALAVESAFDVRLSPGDYGVEVRADDNVIDRVRVDVSRGTLELSVDGTVSSSTLEADVTMPAQELVGVRVRGASTLRAEETFTAPAFEVQAEGASTVSLAVAADDLEVSALGASTVDLEGTAATLRAEAKGASTLKLFAMTAGDATVGAEGASTVEVTATTSLDAEASGASTIRYDGDPGDVVGDSSGASSIDSR